jgi:hypothetical protein
MTLLRGKTIIRSLSTMIAVVSVYLPAFAETPQYNRNAEKSHALSKLEIPPVPSGHPRVYVRPSDLPSIREKLENPEFSKAWNLIKDSDYILCRAFVYMVTGDAKAGRKAIEGWLDDFDEHQDNPDSAGRVFFNLIHTGACIYDWCYDLLNEEEKADFVKRLEKLASSHGPGYPANPDGHAIVGHDTEGWLLTGQLPAGVAIYDETNTMYDAAATLFFRKFVPVRNFLYRSHMHHQGDSYFATRFQHDQAVSWLFRRMGAGDVFTQEQQFVPHQIIYNMRPDGQQLRSGDPFNDRGNDSRKRLIVMMTGSYYNDPYLMTATDSDFFSHYRGHGSVFELLFREPDAEKRPIAELPLTKYFPGPMGEMVARTGWSIGTDSRDAVVNMRIGEYFFGNHQCKDFGIFQIYYRGPLAISTGIYNEYGNAQWINYLHQTISKNGLLIFDPSEKPRRNEANDGGQRWPKGSDHPRDLDVLLSQDYKMGQVTAHEFGPDAVVPDYSYIAGDITDAYSSQKVSQVSRSMVTFNTHNEQYPCLFIVLDRVTSTNPDFKKTWLLHSIQEPEVKGRTISVIRDGKVPGGGEYGGKLVAESLLPDKVNIGKVGGPGKEFWIESTQTNYAAKSRSDAAEPGAWRIEVSPTVKSESDVFLHVLSVMDKTTPKGPEVQRIEKGDLVGAKALDVAILFSKSGQTLEIAEFDIAGEGMTKILVCDLKPGVWSIKRDDAEVGEARATEQGRCIYFKGLAGSYELKLIGR